MLQSLEAERQARPREADLLALETQPRHATGSRRSRRSHRSRPTRPTPAPRRGQPEAARQGVMLSDIDTGPARPSERPRRAPEAGQDQVERLIQRSLASSTPKRWATSWRSSSAVARFRRQLVELDEGARRRRRHPAGAPARAGAVGHPGHACWPRWCSPARSRRSCASPRRRPRTSRSARRRRWTPATASSPATCARIDSGGAPGHGARGGGARRARCPRARARTSPSRAPSRSSGSTNVLYVGRPAGAQPDEHGGLFRARPGGDTAAARPGAAGPRSGATPSRSWAASSEGDRVVLSDMSAWDTSETREAADDDDTAVQAAHRRRSAPPHGQRLLQLEGVTKVFFTDEVETHALSDMHLDSPARASRWPSSGPPAAGKTTLLAILGLLDTPTDGHLPARRREPSRS